MSTAAAARAASLTALFLAGCASLPPPTSLPMDRLPGWSAEDHASAFALVQRVCRAAPRSAGDRACAAATDAGPLGESAARAFLGARYRAVPVDGEGLLTAYYAPEYPARRSPDPEFSAPVRPLPTRSAPDADRTVIEGEPAPDALAWMRPEDLFMLQIQGSGRLTFPDGRSARAAFAGTNGRPFTAIASPMVRQGLLPPSEASSEGVHAWLASHGGPEADALMRLDRRYVFFRLEPDGAGEPTGAAGAPLVAGRSLAVDPASHPFYQLLWIDAEQPTLAGARPAYRRLTAAMDAGGAIKGPLRADLYLGEGPAAGAEAARVSHRLTLFRIVPAE